MKISVVIPCYCSEQTIGDVVELTRSELRGAGFQSEFILVNDGSPDNTFAAIENLCAASDDVVGIDCTNNLGQHSALMAGLQKTTGQLVMLMDDDMQTHPSQCLKLVEALCSHDEWDVVFASWPEHKESWWRKLGSDFAVWSMRVMTGRSKDIYPSNFLIMRDYIRNEIVRYTGPYPYIQGLLFRATHRMANVEVEHFERAQGESGYTMKSLLRLWTRVLGFSMFPLRAASVIGTAIGIVGIIAAIVVIGMRIADPTMQMGWPSLMVTILICSGLILMFLGIVGEYIGRVFMTANNAPQYVIKRTIDTRSSIKTSEKDS